MSDLDWLVYGNGNGGIAYRNIVLVFEHWNNVGKTFLSSGKKVREKILEDFMGDKDVFGYEYEGILESHYERTKEYLEDDDNLRVFNIYLIP